MRFYTRDDHSVGTISAVRPGEEWQDTVPVIDACQSREPAAARSSAVKLRRRKKKGKKKKEKYGRTHTRNAREQKRKHGGWKLSGGYHRDSRIKQMTLLNLAHSAYSLLRFHSFRDTSSLRQVIRSFYFLPPALLDHDSLIFASFSFYGFSVHFPRVSFFSFSLSLSVLFLFPRTVKYKIRTIFRIFL